MTDAAEQGIEKEYDELDTVWFMAGSLFRNYPFQPPSEAFSFPLFLQVRHNGHLCMQARACMASPSALSLNFLPACLLACPSAHAPMAMIALSCCVSDP